MSTIQEIIGDVIKREGGEKETNNPDDRGGRTKYGISEKSNPDLWLDGPPDEAKSRERFEERYFRNPGFYKISDDQLRAHLVDFGVNSGPVVAIQKLQEILGVSADGVLGPKTLAALNARRADDVNNLLVGARVRMIGRIVSKNPSQLKFLNGWLDRSLQFLS